jgi:phage repressor protein C with HTH and peptisase S24 domain
MDDLKQLLADWIRKARKTAGLSQEGLGAELARELGDDRGYTKANISGWETMRHSPNLKQLMAIAKVTGVGLPASIVDAMQSQQPGTTDHTAVAKALSLFPDARPIRVGDEPDTVPIRFVKLKLHAGVAGFETEPEREDGGVLPMPRAVIEKHNLSPAQLLAMRVAGCSMEPMLFEDDVVVINTADKRPISREVYAVNFDGEACVKQLLHQGGQWYLHSLNPDFGPINMRSGQCDIVGRVVYQPGRVVTGRL